MAYFITEEQKNQNLRYYTHSMNVPAEAKKAFNNGKFSGTDIQPMWRIKILTEMFGPCGIGWYFEVLSERSERIDDNNLITIVDINLYIKVDGEWSKPIFGTGGNAVQKSTKAGVAISDEGYKMALTDALSVACKHLGIGADVYYSADKTKYSKYYVDDPVNNVATPTVSEPIAKPNNIITGVVEPTAKNTTEPVATVQPGEITQEMLNEAGTAAIARVKPVPTAYKAMADAVKKVNGGSANYKSVKDAETRKVIYDIFEKYLTIELN